MSIGAVVAYSPPDLTGLTLREAWDLEDSLGDARELLSAHINDEIRRLVGEGWTQAQIGEECGRDQSTISDRMRRLGIRPASNRGRPRIMGTHNSDEPPDADVVEDEAPPAPKPTRPKRGRKPKPTLEDYLPDMLPGAQPEGAFRQEVVAWCDQERHLSSAIAGTGIKLVPKSDDDRRALLAALAAVHKLATRLESELTDDLQAAAA